MAENERARRPVSSRDFTVTAWARSPPDRRQRFRLAGKQHPGQAQHTGIRPRVAGQSLIQVSDQLRGYFRLGGQLDRLGLVTIDHCVDKSGKIIQVFKLRRAAAHLWKLARPLRGGDNGQQQRRAGALAQRQILILAGNPGINAWL